MENINTPIQNSSLPPFSIKGGNLTDPIKPKNVSDESWKTYMEIYNSAKKLGDPYPELVATQAALESGWFKKLSGKNNIFGVKARKDEQGTLVTTHEDSGSGSKYKIKDKFKDYESIEEAVKDRINRFSKIYNNSKTLFGAVESLDKSSYATDTKYGNILKSMLKTQNVNLNKTPNLQNINQTPIINDIFNGDDFKYKDLYEQVLNKKDNIPTIKTRNTNLDLKVDSLMSSSLKDTLKNISDYKQNSLNQIKDIDDINPKSFGGNIISPISDNNLNEYNEGGIHETNPYGGIPQGMGSNGKMNTVEEGETSFEIDGSKFIFSNRITI